MFNRTEFLVQLTRANLTQNELAQKMGIAVSTLNKKMKNGNFNRAEIAVLIDFMHIETPERLYEIFFAPNLRNTQD